MTELRNETIRQLRGEIQDRTKTLADMKERLASIERKPHFGKHPKRNDRLYRTLQLSAYLSPALPPAPLATANLHRVLNATKLTVAELFPMDGNDQYGNCTIAALAHLITMIFAFLGRVVIPARADVVALYFKLTGGADSGLDMLTVCNYIRQNGWLGERPILAFAEIDIANDYRVQQAINLFGFAYAGFQVPADCIAQFDSGGPWVRGPLTQDGHAVPLVDTSRTLGVEALTWGGKVLGTWPWFNECVDEAYVLIPAEAANPGYIPGFNVTQLLADLTAVTP
jgi:hypothetical protein